MVVSRSLNLLPSAQGWGTLEKRLAGLPFAVWLAFGEGKHLLPLVSQAQLVFQVMWKPCSMSLKKLQASSKKNPFFFLMVPNFF